MISRSFLVNEKDFVRRKSTILQHKLRVVMKCYTIRDFNLDLDNKKFTFKISHRVNTYKYDDPKDYSGKYTAEKLEQDNKALLKIFIG